VPRTTITSKGQVTIPKRVRDRLGLRAGDRLDFSVQPDGTLHVSRVPDGEDDLPLYGMFAEAGAKYGPQTLEEMDEAIAEAVIERYRRSLPHSDRGSGID